MRMGRQRTVPLLVEPLRRHSVSLESLRVSPYNNPLKTLKTNSTSTGEGWIGWMRSGWVLNMRFDVI